MRVAISVYVWKEEGVYLGKSEELFVLEKGRVTVGRFSFLYYFLSYCQSYEERKDKRLNEG